MATQTQSAKLLARRQAIVANGVSNINSITIDRANGATFVDLDGREFLDFAGGIGVLNAGHCPEPVVAAIREQAGKFLHSSFNVVTYEPYVALCEKLAKKLPHGERTKALLVTTGAEAVENAIKIAKQATGRQGVLCFSDAFHGRTLMAMSLTSKINYKLNCGPFAPEVYRLPFPNYYRYGNGRSMDTFVADELMNLDENAHSNFDPQNLAAVIVELIQGEGGFNPIPHKYLEGLRSFCDNHGILLIVDEVQSGFGRTGHWASWQHYGVEPDLSTYSKSIASGMPIAAVLGKAEIMDSAAPGTIGGTFIGNPVCCAAALATIAYMEKEKLNERSVKIGNKLAHRLEKMKEANPQIGDVRGLGAMRAIEFVKNNDPRQPDAMFCAAVISKCRDQGLILLVAGIHKNIIRMLCPLIITDEQLTKGMDILEAVINKNKTIV